MRLMSPLGTLHAVTGHNPVLAAMPLMVSPERATTLYPLPVLGLLGWGAGWGCGVEAGALALPGLAYLFHWAVVPRK